MCLIFSKEVSAPKQYSLRRRHETIYREILDHLEGTLRGDKFNVLKSDLQW